MNLYKINEEQKVLNTIAKGIWVSLLSKPNYTTIVTHRVSTVSWRPFIAISTMPRAPTTILKSINHPPFANKYNIVCFIYCIIASVKNFIVLKGCVARVIFSSCCWCVSWSPAKQRIYDYFLNQLFQKIHNHDFERTWTSIRITRKINQIQV